MNTKKPNVLTFVLFAVYMLLLIGIVLFKLPFYSPQISDGVRVINLLPLHGSFDADGAIIWSEIRNNVLIFIPLGIYLCMLKREWTFRKKALFVLGVSFVFEAVQFIFAMGRSDITDVVNNTFGGVIGVGIYILLSKLLGDKTNAIVKIIALLATICVLLRFAHLFYLSHFSMLSPPL